MIKFLDLPHQYQTIKPEIDNAVASVLADGAFIGGKYLDSFEKNFAEFLGASHCIGVGNGTDALEIALEAIGVKKDDEIIVPANSFIASSEAVTRAGCKVVFCDCNAKDFTISIEDLSEKITSKTRAIIAVHLYGHPCDMDTLMEVGRENDIKIIEDCAQAHGAKYKGKSIGTFGDISTFSFFPGKNLGAYGDAGAIVTNNKELADKCRMIKNHGRREKYSHEFEGRNSRLDGLQAAILDVKLKHLASWIFRRNEIAAIYSRSLASVEKIKLPEVESWIYHAYHLYVVRVSERDSLQDFLKSQQIATGVHYPIALPNLPAYKYLGLPKTANPNASQFESEILSLPVGEHLSDEDVYYVAENIQKYLSR